MYNTLVIPGFDPGTLGPQAAPIVLQPAHAILQPAYGSIQPSRAAPLKVTTAPVRPTAPPLNGYVPISTVALKGIDMSTIPMSASMMAGGPVYTPGSGGYVNMSVGYGAVLGRVPLGGNVGVKVGMDGSIHPYVSVGMSNPGPSASITYSPSDVSTGWGGEMSAFYWIGGSVSHDRTWEAGFGVKGGFVGTSYTW